jgi:hypothetical protein
VERWFAYLTEQLLQRSDHRSVQALENDIRAWIKAWNENPRPFMWTKSAEEILASLGRLLRRINGAGSLLAAWGLRAQEISRRWRPRRIIPSSGA